MTRTAQNECEGDHRKLANQELLLAVAPVLMFPEIVFPVIVFSRLVAKSRATEVCFFGNSPFAARGPTCAP